MHKIKQTERVITKQQYKKAVECSKAGECVARHLGFIVGMILFDKFDFSMKKLQNFNGYLKALKEKWLDDDNHNVTNATLLGYANKKKINVVEFVKSIPISQRMYLGDFNGRAAVGSDYNINYAYISSMLLTVAILKEQYKFSNKKIEQFLFWVKYYTDSYYRKEPGTKEHYCSDERIRLAFIEDTGWDIVKGVKVS